MQEFETHPLMKAQQEGVDVSYHDVLLTLGAPRRNPGGFMQQRSQTRGFRLVTHAQLHADHPEA